MELVPEHFIRCGVAPFHENCAIVVLVGSIACELW